MVTVSPNTSAEQLLRLRVRETSSLGPLTCSIVYGYADTWVPGFTTCSVSDLDSNDFLNISTSINIPYDQVASVQIYQVSQSNNTWRELYRGELLATTQSAIIRNSEPFVSYTSASTEYIIF